MAHKVLSCAEVPRLVFLFCPHDSLSIMPFQFESCQLPSTFVKRWMDVPVLSRLVGQVFISEGMLHIGAICIFANLIGPFGGFFASGVKRALKVKVK